MKRQLIASLPKRVSRPALRAHLRRQVGVVRVCIPRHQQLSELVGSKRRHRHGMRKQSELHYGPPKVINTINTDQHGDQHGFL
jgi:hypothetical protein